MQEAFFFVFWLCLFVSTFHPTRGLMNVFKYMLNRCFLYDYLNVSLFFNLILRKLDIQFFITFKCVVIVRLFSFSLSFFLLACMFYYFIIILLYNINFFKISFSIDFFFNYSSRIRLFCLELRIENNSVRFGLFK